MPARHHLSAAAAMAALLLVAPAAQAEGPDGATIGATCYTCHGESGRGSGAVAALAGRPAVATERALQAFKTGTAHGTIMNRLARGYTDEEIRAVADYFESLR